MQTTFPTLVLEHAAHRPRAPASRAKEFGIWQALGWRDLAALVRATACGLARGGP
jgi:long-chain acyl-CoA synthetase